MKKVYSVAPDEKRFLSTKFTARTKKRELQNLLEKNLDLTPGDQVDPDDPRRWLLVKREMMVEIPALLRAAGASIC